MTRPPPFTLLITLVSRKGSNQSKPTFSIQMSAEEISEYQSKVLSIIKIKNLISFCIRTFLNNHENKCIVSDKKMFDIALLTTRMRVRRTQDTNITEKLSINQEIQWTALPRPITLIVSFNLTKQSLSSY